MKASMNDKREPWKRRLWIRQDYPDNYTDPEFINYVKKLRYRGKFAKPSPASAASVKQVRTDLVLFYNKLLKTSLVFIVFTFIYHYKIDPMPYAAAMTAFVLYLSWRSTTPHRVVLKSSLVITFAILTLSPVLKSLSKTTASNSIWTLAFWLTLAYVGSMSPNPKSQTSNLSTNLLLAIVTVLASRLDSSTQVFCFLFICIQLNLILPKLIVFNARLFAVVFSVIVFTFVILALGLSYAILAWSLACFYIFVLPQWFVYWQTYYRGYEASLSRVWESQKPILD
ncbi:GPI2 (YPL076W) [Zygosaccharomyces parabailii]|nr:GPI2 (YPL076W) [Zygosaccharomyces parabailii]